VHHPYLNLDSAPDHDVPLCSVVIPTLYRARELERCLQAVAQFDYPNFETIVVDNSTGDEAARRVAEQSKARIIIEQRRGVSYARNRGAHESRGEVVAYLDDDVVPEPDWLSVIMTEFRDQAVMVVSGPYLPFEAESDYPSLSDLGLARRVVERNTDGWLEFAAFESPARGGNMAIRASVFESWPGFEPQLGRGTPLRAFPRSEIMACGSDDSYAVLKLIELGHKFVYTPTAVVRHPFPQSAAAAREAHYRMLTGWGLYTGFLFVHGYRSAVLKYLVRKLRGHRMRYSHKGALCLREENSFAELCAGLKGLVLFARTELARRFFFQPPSSNPAR
jgi:glycosyltransferase involved in cell wall biosynthesis